MPTPIPALPTLRPLVLLALASATFVVGGCAVAPPAPDAAGTPAAATTPPATDTAKVAAAVAAGVTAGSGGNARPGSSPASVAQAAGAAAAAAAGGPKPFAEVIKDAKEIEGLFRLYQKDEKVWLEIAPEQLDQPFFFKSALNQGIGEKRIFGGAMTYPLGIAEIVAFHKIGNNMQLIAKNTKYTAKAGTPEARAVAAGFSDSLVVAAPVVSLPHPERKSVLIEANALLFADLPGASIELERSYRQSYSFDGKNSSLGKISATADTVNFEVSAHYALGHLNLPPPPPAPSTLPAPPSTLPDVRSLFLGYYYTFARLPAEPMHPRLADDRIGYFTSDRFDFTSDAPRVPIQRYANRWRLEKKDPAAALSEPKQPIVFWLDRNIPVAYRDPIRDGILEWNKAFEKIGYKDAVRVEIQPDDADFDTSDIRHASVRWQTVAKTAYGAIGPTVVDPRSGEILDADIGFDANNVRGVRNLRREYVTGPAPGAAALPGADAWSTSRNALYCAEGEMATQEAVFGLSLLEARGDYEPDGPEVDRFVAAFLKSVTMHEVGHTLGLRHNFRASTVYSEEQLADIEFTRRNGIAGSVMEYNPWNIALPGARQGEYEMSTLGPYDYWAIEYGYRELPAAQEDEALAAILARSREPLLAYATDEDVSVFGLDPTVNQGDLGSDPLAYARKRLALVRELWQRTETMKLRPGESYSILRRNFTRGLAEAGQGAVYAAKYVGGLAISRDHVGDGRAPLAPVDVAKQRDALQLLAKSVFSADSFTFSPRFLRNMSVSLSDIDDADELGRPLPPIDLPIDQQLLGVQRNVLTALMGPGVAQRLLNNASKVDDPNNALRPAELYATLHAAVWSELKTGGDIGLFRRNLQREYALQVVGALLKPQASMPADARSLLRADAKALRDELAVAQSRRTLSVEARAHVAELLATLDEALKSPLVRNAA